MRIDAYVGLLYVYSITSASGTTYSGSRSHWRRTERFGSIVQEYFTCLALALLHYVEENKEEKGAYAPLQGKPWQASKHGTWLVTSARCTSLRGIATVHDNNC